jgi:hypothetical protein
MNRELFALIKSKLEGTRYTVVSCNRFTYVGTKEKTNTFFVFANTRFSSSHLMKQLRLHRNVEGINELSELLMPILIRSKKVKKILKDLN